MIDKDKHKQGGDELGTAVVMNLGIWFPQTQVLVFENPNLEVSEELRGIRPTPGENNRVVWISRR